MDECLEPDYCNNGRCENFIGGFKCSCNGGFVRSEDQTTCEGRSMMKVITLTTTMASAVMIKMMTMTLMIALAMMITLTVTVTMKVMGKITMMMTLETRTTITITLTMKITLTMTMQRWSCDDDNTDLTRLKSRFVISEPQRSSNWRDCWQITPNQDKSNELLVFAGVGALGRTASTTAKTSSDSVISRFCYH